MDVTGFLRELTASRDYRGQIVHTHVIEARPARFAAPSVALHPTLRDSLAHEDIEQLYTHQAAAVDAVHAGHDIVVVTGTASGKTLCYNIPVLDAVLRDPQAKAIYLFPTKALARDQLGGLQRLIAADPRLADVVRPSTYDGDTPQDKRARVRGQANIILTNPDMLHGNILPQHGKWVRFLSDLRFVVLDELHSYRGIFGSHVAGVIRRLQRIAAHYTGPELPIADFRLPISAESRQQSEMGNRRSAIRFVCCSATIANPEELAWRLTGRQVVKIDDDGSPRGRKHFVFWNPPIVEDDSLQRRSANVEAQHLMCDLIERGAQTITFSRARVVAELIYKYVYEQLERHAPKLAERVRPYRGGYLANERREIEKLLFSGQLLGVCSTNALELGIDVGSLDAAIIVGFPGTFCSTWQQAGRAGRSREESLAVFVAYNDPIDQYLVRHADYFLSQSPEHAAIDPWNEKILASQFKCAARELPIGADDAAWFDCDPTAACRRYKEDAVESGDEIWSAWDDGRYDFHIRSGALPHHRVSLRLISNDSFDILDVTEGRNVSIGQVDSISAPELVYPNAIYLHEGENHMVRKLDFEGRIAHVERTEVDYYTQVVLSSHCRVTATAASEPFRGGAKHFGELDVAWQSVAFKKIKYYTLEIIGQDALDLPPQKIHTSGLWVTLPPEVVAKLVASEYKPVEALVGIRNLLLVTLPMLAMCDRRDISGVVESSNLGQLAMFVYDRYEGGLGFARKGYEHFGELLAACRAIVEECPCTTGCPSCVGLPNLRPPQHSDPDLDGGYAIPNKTATLVALDAWCV